MKKIVIFVILLGMSILPANFVGASFEKNENHHEHGHHHKFIDCEKAMELKEKGYSKQDIFTGALLGKKANKDIDEVLAIYKENKSWEKTAEQLGVNPEEIKRIDAMRKWDQFVKEHPEAVMEYIGTYTNTKKADIQAYIDEDIPLRFLIGAAVLAKLSDKKLDEMVAYKKEGKSFHDIMEELHINREDLHKELNQFRSDVQQKVGN